MKQAVKRYFLIAMGSSGEFEYLLLMGYDLGYLQAK